MTPAQIVFILCAVFILGTALMVVTARKLIRAALWLIATLFGVAVLYALLEAGFLAVVQVVVYIGAIAILFIFTVMLTRRELRDESPQLRKNWGLAALLGFLVFIGLAVLLARQPGVGRTPAVIPDGLETVLELGRSLVSPQGYLLPFEVISVLLLAALVGAVYIAFTRKS